MSKKKIYKTFKVEKDGEQKELGVTEFVAIENRDRLSACGLTDEGTYVLEQINTEDSNREPHARLHMTKESLVGLIGSVVVLLNYEKEDIYELIDYYLQEENTVGDSSYHRREEEQE